MKKQNMKKEALKKREVRNIDDEVSLEFLDRMAKVISEMFGSNCEVCISDLSNPNDSVKAIYNGHVTGRKVGSPLSETSSKRVSESKGGEYINYRKTTHRNSKQIKSSTILANVKGKPYSFCINYDSTDLENIKAQLSAFLFMKEDKFDEKIPKNNDEKSLVENIVDKELEKTGKRLQELTREERIVIMQNLKERGFFEMHKAIPILADKMGVSRYTIYNYLKRMR